MEQIETVGDLIAALQDYEPYTTVRLASGTQWPLVYTVGPVALTRDDLEGDDTEPTGDPIGWIGEGRQVGYLPGVATHALGW